MIVHNYAPGIGETDAQLLSDRWYACHNRAIGVTITAMGVSPVVAQWALAELVPEPLLSGVLAPPGPVRSVLDNENHRRSFRAVCLCPGGSTDR